MRNWAKRHKILVGSFFWLAVILIPYAITGWAWLPPILGVVLVLAIIKWFDDRKRKLAREKRESVNSDKKA